MATGFPARWVAVAAICAAAPAVARAERRPVAVISVSEDPDASTLAKDLNDTLVAHPDLRPIDPLFVVALQGTFLNEDAEQLTIARTARSEADAALGLSQPDFRGAQIAATRGIDALTQVLWNPEAATNPRMIYADLMFDLGIAQLGQNKPIDASRSFALVHRLDPARNPDPARYVSEIVDAYSAAARATVATSPLTIKGTGTVWIDGKQVGEAPHTETVDDGIHVVQLTGADREPRGEQVLTPQISEIEVAPAPATEELKVKRARRELARAKDPLTRASAVKRLAALLQIGDAVIISKSPGGSLLVQTWRDREFGFSAIRSHDTEKPIDLLTPLAPPRKPEQITPPAVIPLPPLVVEKPWYRKRWVQASAATGILAAIVTAVVIIRQDRMTTWDPNIQPGMQ